jgi:nitrite reductase (NO-forming)
MRPRLLHPHPRGRRGGVPPGGIHNHPSSKLPHNIDLHAVTGPGGGASSTFTAPGHSRSSPSGAQPRPLRLPLRHGPGAHAHRQRHVRPHPRRAQGGPAQGRPRVLRDAGRVLHHRQATARKGLQSFDMAKAIDERPPYIVFNGSVGSLVGDKAITAKVGETSASTSASAAPTSCPPSTSSARSSTGSTRGRHQVTPGARPDHAGALRRRDHRRVQGRCARHVHPRRPLAHPRLQQGRPRHAQGRRPEDRVIYSGKEIDAVYIGSQADPGSGAAVATASAAAEAGKLTVEQQVAAGKALYAGTCSACHQADGKGLPPTFAAGCLATSPRRPRRSWSVTS